MPGAAEGLWLGVLLLVAGAEPLVMALRGEARTVRTLSGGSGCEHS